jgi:N-acetylmuramoyl-L-alanine amidase
MQKSKFFPIGAAFFALLLSTADLRADFAWNLIKVDKREYLTLENIAQFYQLRVDTSNPGHHAILTDGRTRLETTGHPKELVINGIRQWLSFPMLDQGGHTLVSRFDLAKTVEPCLRPTMIGNLHPFDTVVIDAGHGGADKGANSAVGYEKDYTLDVIKNLKRSLENKGLRVLMTRDSDTYIALDNRAQYSNEVKDAIFVSVHFNSCNDGGSANGFEVYAMTPLGAISTADRAATLEQFQNQPGNDYDNASLALATSVHHSLLGHIPQQDRGVKRARFAVLRLTHAPAVLVEGGFLTNRTESQWINDAGWRKKLAESIAQGVQSYAELANRKIPPKLLADYRSEQLPMAGTMVDPAAVAARAPLSPADLVPVNNPAGAPPAPASPIH